MGMPKPLTPARTVIHSKKLKCACDVGACKTNPNVKARPVRIQSYWNVDQSSVPAEAGGTICATASPRDHKMDPVTILVGMGRACKCPSYHSTNEADFVGVVAVLVVSVAADDEEDDEDVSDRCVVVVVLVLEAKEVLLFLNVVVGFIQGRAVVVKK